MSQKIIYIVIMITDLKKSIFWVKNDFGLFFEILTFFGRKIDLFGQKNVLTEITKKEK